MLVDFNHMMNFIHQIKCRFHVNMNGCVIFLYDHYTRHRVSYSYSKRLTTTYPYEDSSKIRFVF